MYVTCYVTHLREGCVHALCIAEQVFSSLSLRRLLSQTFGRRLRGRIHRRSFFPWRAIKSVSVSIYSSCASSLSEGTSFRYDSARRPTPGRRARCTDSAARVSPQIRACCRKHVTSRTSAKCHNCNMRRRAGSHTCTSSAALHVHSKPPAHRTHRNIHVIPSQNA